MNDTPTPSQVIENGHRTFASKSDLLVTERAKELRKASQDLRIEIGRLNNELTAARAEIRVLRLFGNNGCTAMADEYLTNKKDEK